MFFSIATLFEKVEQAQSAPPRVRAKVHDFTRQRQGQDYCLGHAPNEASTNNLFYMTGVGDGIQQNDQILLQQNSGSVLYRVVEVDHYSNAKNLWIALLMPVEQSQVQ